ncbi:MAG: LptF/LptG family permease [Bacteroidales bacterium]|nr:LptF/LptG family permease [Candidatus Cryptobacteroides caccocaballi]
MIDLRPKILDKYIVKKFITTFFVSLILIIGIVIIFDISEKIDDFVSNSAPLRAIIVDYYLNFVPYFMNMFSPLFVFITVIFFTSKLAANTEIVAILSCGISYHRMMVPYLFSAFIIFAVSLCLNLWVIPRANATRIPFEQQYVSGSQAFTSRNVHYQTAPGQFIYVESFSSWNNTAYKMTVEEIEDNKLVSKLSAETAVYDSTKCCWTLKNYFIRDYGENLDDKITSGEQIDTVLNLEVADFYRDKKTVSTLPQKQLNELIETQILRGDANVRQTLIEKHTRIALPFSAFILTIMGVSLSSKKKRGGIGWNIGIGIALAFTYILFLKFSEMFVYAGGMSPGIALWIPNIVYTFITAFLYKIAPK